MFKGLNHAKNLAFEDSVRHKNISVIWICVIGYCFEFRDSIFEFFVQRKKIMMLVLYRCPLQATGYAGGHDSCLPAIGQKGGDIFLTFQEVVFYEARSL